jgi:hypothetical protein
MFVARWQIDAKFGHKQKVLDLMRRWDADIGRPAGTGDMGFQLLTGSIGVREATVETDHRIETLAQLEAFFAAIGKNPAHAEWGKELEPFVVSGSSAWQIFRVV